jgi:hypothetical protein
MRRLIKGVHALSAQLGYIYLFYYENAVEFKSPGRDPYIVVEKLHKIGISKHPRKRFKQVASDLPGRLYFQGCWAVFDPRGLETYFGRKYRKYKQEPIDAGPRAGKNEFFCFQNMYDGRSKLVERRRTALYRVIAIIYLKWGVLRLLTPALLILALSVFFISNQDFILKGIEIYHYIKYYLSRVV